MKASVGSTLRHVALLAIGVAMVAALVSYGGLEALAGTVHARPVPTVGAVLATAAIAVLLTERWQRFARALATQSFSDRAGLLRIVLSTRLLGFVVPKDASDLVGRSLLLARRHPLSIADAGLSVLLDRLCDLLVIASMALVVTPWWLGWLPTPSTFAAVALASAAIVAAGSLTGPAVLAPLASAADWVRRHWARWRSRPAPAPAALDRIDRSMLRNALMLSVAKLWLVVGRSVLVAWALGLELSPAVLLLATPLVQVVYVLAFTPGGLGLTEAGWVGVLVAAGTPAEVAVAFAVGQRAIVLASVAAAWLVTLLFRSSAKRSTDHLA